MLKIILIYANCWNPKSLGDFALAGSIARDLATNPRSSGMKIILTTKSSQLTKFEALYGTAVNGQLTIEGQAISLCSLELIDVVEHEVVAFIEANPCNSPTRDDLMRIISLESKILIIGAAHRKAMTNETQVKDIVEQYGHIEAMLSFFNRQDILINASGIGSYLLGLPSFKTLDQLPELDLTQKPIIPTENYGFMYLAADEEDSELPLITQYIQLSLMNRYILVGNFNNKKDKIQALLSQLERPVPEIEYHASINNVLMRKAAAQSTNQLVLSTGVMSTLEVMHDGKLPYYQYLEHNYDFISSYLIAVKSICDNNNSLTGNMAQFIIELSCLLFDKKPLTNDAMNRTQQLVHMPHVVSNLIAANQKILNKANGRLAPRLLSFIGNATKTSAHYQYEKARLFLRNYNESDIPIPGDALRRAAAKGHVFLLKVLIKSVTRAIINSVSKYAIKNTALHCAVYGNSLDCVRLLVLAGAKVDTQNSKGQTPLHLAVVNGNKETIEYLIIEGNASLDIKDSSDTLPSQESGKSFKEFIELCCERRDRHKFLHI